MRRSQNVRFKISSRVIRRQSHSFIVPLVLLCVVLFTLAACGSSTTTGAGSTPTSGTTPTAGKTPSGCPNTAGVTPSQKIPNVTLHVADGNSTSSAHQGDLIEVQLPISQKWSGPTTSQGVLELQSPYGYVEPTLKMCIWQFVAKGSGTAHLNFTGRAICLPGQLCPQYVMSVPFVVVVK